MPKSFSFKRILLQAVGAQGVSVVCGFLMTVVLARNLGPSLRGELALFLATVNTLSILRTFIVGGNHILLSENLMRLRSLMKQALLTSIGLGGGFLILFLTSPRLSEFFIGNHSTYQIALCALALVLVSMSAPFRQLITVYQEVSFLNKTQVKVAVLHLMLLVAALSILKGEMLVAAIGVYIVIQKITLWIYFRKLTAEKEYGANECEQAKLFGESFLLGLKSFGVSIGVILILKSDLWILGSLGSSVEVGHYQIAVGLCTIFWTVTNVVGYLIRTKALVESGGAERTMVLAQLIFYGGLICWPVVYLSSEGFVLVAYGAEYLSAAKVIPVLWPACVLWAVATALGSFMSVKERVPVWIPVTLLIGLLINLSLNILWIPNYSIVGAAAASLAAYGFVFCVHVYQYMRFACVGLHSVVVPNVERFKKLARMTSLLG